jgi:hypothetical protein
MNKRELMNTTKPTDEEMIRWFLDLGMGDDWIVWIMKDNAITGVEVLHSRD